MGLSASMWTSVSGLLAHGNKMNVVGNNIANVSTIGFKSQRMDFNDYLYISGGSTSGTVQIGAGVATYAVIGDFSQGSLESTNSVTDIAIDGEGFFKVRQPNSDQMYYTRAGDFYFNADRQLQNPEGYRLQGWKIDNSTRLTFKSDSVNLGESSADESAFQGTGTPVDIVLDSWYLEPQRTSSVNFTIGLTSDGASDKSTSTNSPLTALFDQWDASKNPPMADSAFAYQSPIKVYDEGGTAHTLTVYYDQVATQAKDADGNVIYSIDGLPAGYTMYEYCVTIPPEEDMRSYGGTGFNAATNEFDGDDPISFYNDPEHGTNKMAGMLMTGHLIFDAAGNLVNQTAYTYGANTDIPSGDQCSLQPEQLGSWQATKFSSNGLPVLCANFTGQPLANSVNETLSATQSQAQDYLIEIDFGLRTTGDWTYAGSLEDLTGTLGVPPTNTETRISVVSNKKSYEATFVPANPNATPPTQASWTIAANADMPNGYSEAVTKDPAIFYTDGKGDKHQIEVNTKGPVTMWADRTTGKEVEVVDPGNGQTPTLPDGSPLPNTVFKCYKGIDGKPVFNIDANGDYDHVSVPPDGTDKYTMDVTLKSLPQSFLKNDYTKVDENGNLVDVDLKNDIYALSSDGARLKIQYNDDGIITGVEVPGSTPVAYQPYNGEKLYLDQAKAERHIDYNRDFSVYDTPIRAENSTKAGGSSFVTQDAGQNGYASGILSGTNITADGVVYGYYDNGETVPLYQIALYDFHNKQGLRREGGNLYAQTKESGEARQGVAGEAGFGNTKAYNIESSNVDMSREFVNMITTQRGFQANSKGITTVDTMLETVIGMKR